MAIRSSNLEAVNRMLDKGQMGSELHAMIKGRQWSGAASLINEQSARFKQWGRLPLHWAALKNAPLYIVEHLLVCYPEGSRMKDSCPQVSAASLAKTDQVRRTIRECARDPIAWRASLVSQCLESGESSVSSRNYEKALTQYEHGLRVVPTHTELNAGKLATQRMQSESRVLALIAWQKS